MASEGVEADAAGGWRPENAAADCSPPALPTPELTPANAWAAALAWAEPEPMAWVAVAAKVKRGGARWAD